MAIPWTFRDLDDVGRYIVRKVIAERDRREYDDLTPDQHSDLCKAAHIRAKATPNGAVVTWGDLVLR